MGRSRFLCLPEFLGSIQNTRIIGIVTPFTKRVPLRQVARVSTSAVLVLQTLNQKDSMKTNSTAKSTAPVPMTVRDASRIYSATAGHNNGAVPKGSFATRAMSAAMTSANANGSRSR